MSGELAGKAGIVTGAGRGLGLEIARRFLDAGAQVAIFERDEALAAEAVGELGDALAVFVVDVTDADAVERATAGAADRFGRLDYLVNNAGVREMAPFEEHPLDMWKRTIDVNVHGSFICAQAAIRRMLPAGGGKIVNLASIAGRLALKRRAAYNTSKGAVISLTQSIAAELGSRGIHCNAIAPGIIETPLSAPYFRDAAMREVITANTPLGRWGQGHEIAEPAVFLCGRASDFINGEVLFVDGGWNAAKGY